VLPPLAWFRTWWHFSFVGLPMSAVHLQNSQLSVTSRNTLSHAKNERGLRAHLTVPAVSFTSKCAHTHDFNLELALVYPLEPGATRRCQWK
jgi:hypothetical protein